MINIFWWQLLLIGMFGFPVGIALIVYTVYLIIFTVKMAWGIIKAFLEGV